MLKTITLDIVNDADLGDFPRIYSSMVRIAYNRAKEGMDNKGIRKYLKDRFSNINSWLIACATVDGVTTHKSNVDGNPIIFGGKHNYDLYMAHLITKEEYKSAKIMPILSVGEACKYGNRLFDFNFPECTLTFTPRNTIKIPITFKRLKPKIMDELCRLQILSDSRAIPITVRLTTSKVFISYEETLLNLANYEHLLVNRIMGIDLNPNYIGVSIIEFNASDTFKILYKEVIDLRKMNKYPTGLSSSNHKRTHVTNKRKHELIEIAYRIDRLAKYWKCGKISVEKLRIKPHNLNKGKRLNTLINNKWLREIITTKIHMLADIHGIDYREVSAQYSSVIGNLYYGDEHTPDMCAAAIELARRAHKQYENGWLLPDPDITLCQEQWKQTIIGASRWGDVYSKLKNSGQRYRVLLSDTQCRFRSFNHKSLISFSYY